VRNEHTERNQNVRTAGFDILTKLAEFERWYSSRNTIGRQRPQSAHRLDLHDRDPDLSDVMPEQVTLQATSLQKSGARNWEGLGKDDDAAINRITMRSRSCVRLHCKRCIHCVESGCSRGAAFRL